MVHYKCADSLCICKKDIYRKHCYTCINLLFDSSRTYCDLCAATHTAKRKLRELKKTIGFDKTAKIPLIGVNGFGYIDLNK